ncbi:peptidase [Paraneptunicella aestuarii]|uniref:PepSY domain-containing protein n=1 Tax=Paraneptunicella aestuarii TaxID=2831148 RepID=UPI001E4B0BA9|nr:peptidase [Paraneptunicella aestuarii]UAA37355.1 peptidase [Paraneptunicella aestuarii]
MRNLIFIISLLTTLSVFAWQQQDTNDDYADNKAQAARKAKLKVQGRILKVEQLQTIYKVKLLQKSGRVVTVEIKRTVQIQTPLKPM